MHQTNLLKRYREVKVQGELLCLLPECALFWPEQNLLAIADAHFGKSQTFHKSGIGIPDKSGDDDLDRLSAMLQNTGATRCIFLGDLFHSEFNSFWNEFRNRLNHHSSVEFHLIRGNHDILSPEYYENADLTVHDDSYIVGPFRFVHNIDRHRTNAPPGYVIGGHVHPAVRMKGKGRQSATFRCFLFGTTHALLPAFGSFTGNAQIAPSEDDQVYIVSEDRVLPV